MASARARGQAAVETVGLVVLLALVATAAAAWLAASARPPERPPDVVAHVTRPLRVPDGPVWPSLPVGVAPRAEPIGDVLRAAGRTAAGAGRGYWAARREFNRAYRARLRERGGEVLEDPLGGLATPPTDDLGPAALVRRALRDARSAGEYVRRLRALPREERVATLMRDAGTWTADVTVDAVQALLRRRAGRARASRRPDPPTDAPAP